MAGKPCPFCNLDTEKNRVLYENEDVVVALSNPRLMEGHTLVIPKQHVGALYDVVNIVSVFKTVFHFQQKIIRVFSERGGWPAGCDVSWHTRPFMPQTELTIPGHAHVHLRPRYWQDPYYEEVLKYETAVFQPLGDKEKAIYQGLLGEGVR